MQRYQPSFLSSVLSYPVEEATTEPAQLCDAQAQLFRLNPRGANGVNRFAIKLPFCKNQCQLWRRGIDI
jgi:hypothetical protein